MKYIFDSNLYTLSKIQTGSGIIIYNDNLHFQITITESIHSNANANTYLQSQKCPTILEHRFHKQIITKTNKLSQIIKSDKHNSLN